MRQKEVQSEKDKTDCIARHIARTYRDTEFRSAARQRGNACAHSSSRTRHRPHAGFRHRRAGRVAYGCDISCYGVYRRCGHADRSSFSKSSRVDFAKDIRARRRVRRYARARRAHASRIEKIRARHCLRHEGQTVAHRRRRKRARRYDQHGAGARYDMGYIRRKKRRRHTHFARVYDGNDFHKFCHRTHRISVAYAAYRVCLAQTGLRIRRQTAPRKSRRPARGFPRCLARRRQLRTCGRSRRQPFPAGMRFLREIRLTNPCRKHIIK